jgi:1,4-alpha-glucan branching enzyme
LARAEEETDMETTTEKQQVQFRCVDKPGSEVFVAGTFNAWNPHRNRLREHGRSGVYTTTLRLPKGQYEYKFVVNGEWRADDGCLEAVLNGFGSQNSVVSV